MTYNLRAEVQTLLETGEIASKMIESIPEASLRDALRVTMRSYVREVERSSRNLRDTARPLARSRIPPSAQLERNRK